MIIGRKEEQQILKDALSGNKSEFIAIYGRRRVGKTFLVKETFKDAIFFQHAGIYNASREEELQAFFLSLNNYGLKGYDSPHNWLEAFDLLKQLAIKSKKKRKIIFLDELSWMDTPKSGFIKALEHFWNGWASTRDDIVLIVCSSVTSWMIKRLIHSKGGLYNRLTHRINLSPFSLKECEQYAKSMSFNMTRPQILEAYMILGGIPYYWSFMQKKNSLPQNIDYLIFSKNAPLKDEFDHLFAALFANPTDYISIIKSLAKKSSGLTRNEIIKSSGITGSGILTEKLADLENSGFIRSFRAFHKQKKDTCYQLIDPFTIFYYNFLEKQPKDNHFWSNQYGSPKINTWSGLAFEKICLLNIDNIKKALGISGVLTEEFSYNIKEDSEKGISGSQIDLLLVRNDKVINIIETKYSQSAYVITKSVDADMRRKKSDLIRATNTKSSIHTTFITVYGLAKNSYYGNIQSEITIDDLFL